MNIDFVTVGNPGNAADTDVNTNRNGYGAVDYVYKMGTYEVTRNQWDTVAGAAGITIGVGAPRFSGDQPVTEVAWYGAAQFCNWLTTGDKSLHVHLQRRRDGNHGSLDRSYLPQRRRRSLRHPKRGRVVQGGLLRSEQGRHRRLLAVSEDTAPTPLGGGTTGAVYSRYSGGTYPSLAYPESVLLAGSSNAYGTIAQSGNAFEWIEDYYSGSSGDRVRRGASYANNADLIAATWRGSRPPTSVDTPYNLGFRVAMIPEPGGMTMLILGAMIVLLRRRRGAH